MTTWIVAGILIFIFLIRAFFRIVIFPASYTDKKTASDKNTTRPLSVIIATRNEEKNLDKNLDKILSQNYPKFELIVVDDCSTDNTKDILEKYSAKYPNFYHTWVPDGKQFRRGKKIAVSIGIKAANYEHLVFTDADCYPETEYWLKNIGEAFSESNHFVLGYGAYEQKKGLISKMVSYDTLNIAMTYGGMAKRFKPYMGVGRNMAYKKSLWYKVGGFRKFSDSLSGDDDLFVNYFAKRKNTEVVFKKEAKTLSLPPSSLKEWIKQKSRHISGSKHYKKGLKIFLACDSISGFILPFALSVWYFISPDILYFVIAVSAMFLVRLMHTYNLYRFSKLSGEKNMILISPFFDVLLPIFYFIFVLLAKRQGRKKTWK